MEHELTRTVDLPVSRDDVFRFFADAANLQRITPPELHFSIITPPPIVMATGTIIEYRLRLFGLPFSWVSRIADWTPPYGFVDVQLRGPYARWEHTHAFEEVGGATRIRDTVRYRLPYAPLSEFAYPLVRAQLSRIFAYRERAVTRALTHG